MSHVSDRHSGRRSGSEIRPLEGRHRAATPRRPRRRSLRFRVAEVAAAGIAGSVLLAVPVTTGAELPGARPAPDAVGRSAGPAREAARPTVGPSATAVIEAQVSRVAAAPRPTPTRLASTSLRWATGAVASTGEILLPGRSLQNGRNRLVLTRNGDLELFAGSLEVWSSDTSGHPRARALMQPDGNLVLRTPGGRAIWSSRTAGRPGARLIVARTAEALVQSRAGRVLWRTTAAAVGAPTSVKGYAMAQLALRGWGGASQWSCLQSLWQRESGWEYTAANPSGAYGIPQALPGSKMASAGADWRTNPMTQIRWGLGYIASRYGSPCGAWSHSEGYGWY